jgi:hypothetical protein
MGHDVRVADVAENVNPCDDRAPFGGVAMLATGARRALTPLGAYAMVATGCRDGR